MLRPSSFLFSFFFREYSEMGVVAHCFIFKALCCFFFFYEPNQPFFSILQFIGALFQIFRTKTQSPKDHKSLFLVHNKCFIENIQTVNFLGIFVAISLQSFSFFFLPSLPSSLLLSFFFLSCILFFFLYIFLYFSFTQLYSHRKMIVDVYHWACQSFAGNP